MQQDQSRQEFSPRRQRSPSRSPGDDSGIHRDLLAASSPSGGSRLHRPLPVAPSHPALLLLVTYPPISSPARSAPKEAALLAGVAVVFVAPIILSVDDQFEAVARLRGAAGVAAADGQPRRLLPVFRQSHSEQVSFFPR
jgi:hypothetical protein